MLFLLMMSEIVYPKNLCIVGQSYKYLFTFCQSIPGYKGITHSRENGMITIMQNIIINGAVNNAYQPFLSSSLSLIPFLK